MRIHISELKSTLTLFKGVRDKGTKTSPIYDCVRIDESIDMATISFVSQAGQFHRFLSDVEDIQPGRSFLLPIDEALVALTGKPNTGVVSVTEGKIEFNNQFVCKVPVYSHKGYCVPDVIIDRSKSVSIPKMGLQLKRIFHAASKDYSRFNLDAILFDGDCIVATDGNRLAMVNMEVSFESLGRFGVHRSVLKMFLHKGLIESDIAINRISDDNVLFESKGWRFVVKVVDNYPDYQRVLDEGSKYIYTGTIIKKKPLFDALDMFKGVVTKDDKAILIEINNGGGDSVTISKNGSRISVPIDEVSGKGTSLMINWLLFSETVIGGKTRIKGSSQKDISIDWPNRPGTPVFIRDGDYTGVVMPLRKS